MKDAVALLDERLAAGIQATKQLQQRFRKQGRRIDPADCGDALQRFQADAHEGIALLNDRLDEMRSQENFDLVQERVERSHDLVDVAVELVNGRVSRNTGLRRKALHPGNDSVRGQS